MVEKSCASTFIQGGRVSEEFLHRVIAVNKSNQMSLSDAFAVCMYFDIYDKPGQTNRDVAFALGTGFGNMIDKMVRCKGVSTLVDEYRILSCLCGFEQMCNVANAMACGATLSKSVHTTNDTIEFFVETRMEPIMTEEEVDEFHGFDRE